MKNYLSQITKPNWKTALSGLILTMIFFFTMLMSFKTYQSTVTILVVSKTESAAINHDQIVNSVAEFPKSLNFYKLLISSNHDIRENEPEKTDLEKRDDWNDMMSIKRSPKNSSLIKLTINSVNQNDAEKISSKAARTLLDLTSSYYNVKTDLDLRIIDGPVTESSFEFWPLQLIVSILLGFVLAYVLQNTMIPFGKRLLAVGNMTKEKLSFGKKEKEENVEPSAAKLDTGTQKAVSEETNDEPQPQVEEQNPSSQEDEELERLNKMIQQDIYPNFPEMPVAHKKSDAPDNLPIADSSMFPTQENAAEQTEEEVSFPKHDQPVEEVDTKREPTPEELKQRLNQLLKGKI